MMKITKYKAKRHQFVFQFLYDQDVVNEMRNLKNLYGGDAISFYKDPAIVGWSFSSMEIFWEIYDRYSPEVSSDVLSKFRSAREKSLAIQTITSNIDVPTKVELFDFQKEAIDFAKKAGGRALINYDMGLGKSCISIGYGVREGSKNVLIICPPYLKENWRREIDKFAGIDGNILSDSTMTEEDSWDITGYTNLEKFQEYLLKKKYGLIILDECQYIKNKKSKRSKLALMILKNHRKDILFLSGTPIMNRPIEIYPIYNFLVRKMTYFEFARIFCDGHQTRFGYDVSGSSNLDILSRHLSSVMIRRMKEQVLDSLPDKTVSIINSSMDDRKEYNQALNDFKEWAKGKNLSDNTVYFEALTKANYLRQISVKHKNIEEILDGFSDTKVLVFSCFKSTVKRIQDHYGASCCSFTGEVPANERQSIVDEFQNDPKKKILICTMASGGTGFNITAADTVIFTDMSYVPSDHAQAEARVHRYGQKNAVNVYYLITKGTIEEKIWSILKRKEKIISAVMEGEQSRKVHMKSLFKSLGK